ncbi:ribose-phosphate pyrophosphokinase [Marivirga sp. S37H4]|uniref:ribose-phosphate diphosphokinase n=1 Tax=Marivirga aurantiaca TaxID=2802615 RepID=A0A934WZS9_9BACT|nr:ribose-phosphate diphosphokinase [Marivirga aurantiaca]MBK6265775.1 ribose-phosphate pyrophosphokinase [Marivirga aurantiaca]
MKKLLFYTTKYKYLADKILAENSFEEGQVEVKEFTDGERYQRILNQVENRDVILLGGTVCDADTLELYDLASALVSYGANSLSLVVPYFGYSTMERAVKPGEIVTAKTRARLLSSIPKSHKGNKIYLFDLHTEGIPHYFENDLQPVHVYCKEIIIEAAKSVGGKDFVLASTDAGRAKWVESLANDIGVNAAFLLKRRLEEDKTEISAVNADVKGKTVVIYDDMIRSGGSIINAAKVYKEAGASSIFVITTHGIFINDGLQKLENCGLVEMVVTTDTHCHMNRENSNFLKIHSIAPLVNQLFR